MDPSQYEVGASGCVAAFRSVKAGKKVFMLLVILALVGQLAGFILVQFMGVIDPLDTGPTAAAARTTTQPTTQEVVQRSEERAEAAYSTTFWREILRWGLPALRFMALVAGLLAILTIMFAVKLSLVGKLGGIAGFMSAFFWSLVLLATITPWQQVLGGQFASGALYNLGELTREVSQVNKSWGAESVKTLDLMLFYARFIAYPVLALLVWAMVTAKFARGYRESILAPVGTIADERPSAPSGTEQ